MAATGTKPEVKGGDEAEQKLLEGILEKKGAVSTSPSIKSAKKVKLPEESLGPGGGGRFTIGPAPERDWEMVPPDGKWGWCVLVGATLVNILIPGTIKSFGVLLVEFNDVFEASASASSGIVAVCYFLYSSLGPVSSILSVKWSYRTVTLIGGSLAAFGMIFSSLANNITYMYFSFGAMVGAGAGLAFPPTVYIVTSYFVRLRGLANGICMSGSAFGSIILPPVLRHLLEEYGYQGAVLILGGIMLNVWAAALLFQPVEQHMVKRYREPEDEEEYPQNVIQYEEPEEKLTLPTIPDANVIDKIEKSLFQKTKTPVKETPKEEKIKPSTDVEIRLPADSSEKRLSEEKLTISDDKQTDKAQGTSKQISRSQNASQQNFRQTKRKLSSRSIPKPYSSASMVKLDYGIASPSPMSSRRNTRTYSTSSFAFMSNPVLGSTMTAFEEPNEFASQFSLKSVAGSVREAYFCFCCKKRPAEDREPSTFFDTNLLKDPTYLVILISSSTVAISYTNFIILLPSYAKNIGFDKARGAYLLSTVSALDLVGRIGGSALSDLRLIPTTFYFVGGLFISGVCLVIIPNLHTYLAVSILCGIFGLTSGMNNSVTPLVMAEKLGVQRLMSTYGISLFVNGFIQLIGPPVCGLWFEQANSYFAMFITFGFIFIWGSSLWIFMPFIEKRKRRLEALELESAPPETKE